MQRNTVQRQITLEALIKLPTHPTVEEVYIEVHKKHPTISKATIYRNLRQLADHGRIRQIFIGGLDRFDGRTEAHCHFKCKECGGISDVDIGCLSELRGAAEEKYGFKAEDLDFVFRGVCKNCIAHARILNKPQQTYNEMEVAP